MERNQAVQSLVETVQDNNEVIAIWTSLDFRPKTLAQKSKDRHRQLHQLQCCWEAAGQAHVPLQVQLFLDPGTDNSHEEVLRDFESSLGQACHLHPDLAVHMTSWTGRADQMTHLLQTFPNNVQALGLDGSVTFAKATHLHECAFDVPLNRLALETSNIIPSAVANTMGRAAFGHSAWWPFVAESVAMYKNNVATLEQVVCAACDNAVRLYPQLAEARQGEQKDGKSSDTTTGEDNV